MGTYKFEDARVMWNEASDTDPGAVKVLGAREHSRLPREARYSKWLDARDLYDGFKGSNDPLPETKKAKALTLFVLFHTLIVRDGISTQEAHREFLKIEGYSEMISPEISGATFADENG